MGDLLPGVVNAGNGWGGRISSGEKGTHRRFCDSDDEEGEEEGDGERGSSVHDGSSVVTASESKKKRVEAEGYVNEGVSDSFSDSDSSNHSELGSENDEMESTSRNKVSAAPGTLEGHDSDNSSVKNSSERLRRCFDCGFSEDQCYCDGQNIPKKAERAEEASILDRNIDYVEKSVLSLPRGARSSYVIDKPPRNVDESQKMVYTNNKGNDMTVDCFAHKFTAIKECTFNDFYAPSLLRAKNQENGANEKTFLLCRFERQSEKWQAMLLDLNDGKTEHRVSLSSLHNSYERLADQTWQEEYGGHVHELLEQNIKPFQEFKEVIVIDDGTPSAGTRRTSSRLRSASLSSAEAHFGSTSTGSTTKSKASRSKVPPPKKQGKQGKTKQNTSRSATNKGKAKRNSRDVATFDPFSNLTSQDGYISDEEVESRTSATERQLSRKVQRLEEQLRREREESKNVTEQLNRLRNVQVEQQGTFLPPGPAAAPPPPPLSAYNMPYYPKGPKSYPPGGGPQSYPPGGGPQSYPPGGGPQSYPPVGESGQHLQIPQGHPFAPVNKYYIYNHL